MILGALNEVGGMDYLAQQATANPAAFMTLLGKVLPPGSRATLKCAITFFAQLCQSKVQMNGSSYTHPATAECC